MFDIQQIPLLLSSGIRLMSHVWTELWSVRRLTGWRITNDDLEVGVTKGRDTKIKLV